MKKLTSILLALIFTICLVPYVSADEGRTDFMIRLNVQYNTERKTTSVVVYDGSAGDSYSASGTGTEFIVGSDGVISEKLSGGGAEIPNGGFVISAGSATNSKVSGIQVGDYASFNKEYSLLTVISPEYEPFNKVTLQYTGVNSTRVDNSMIIYRDKATTGTNTWGYEVVVDADGVIISVGGNNSEIPEGGFVISAIGTKKQPLIDAAQLGMTAEYDAVSREVTIGYDKSKASAKYTLAISSIKKEYDDKFYGFYDFELYSTDNSLINDKLEQLDALRSKLETAISNGDFLTYAEYDHIFELTSDEIRLGLFTQSSVESRTLWLRIPTTARASTAKNVVEQISSWGFNSVCLEFMFDNTVIVPMPEGSLFVQNPAFGGEDMLKIYIDEFHNAGIEVHLWMSCYRVGYEGSANTSYSVGYNKPEYLNTSNTGKTTVYNEYGNAFFLNPALPEVKELLLDMYKYVLENYDIDGFQLDYVRYPESSGMVFGYDDYSKQLFTEKYGYANVPTASGQQGWKEWTELRASFVTDLVSSVKSLIDEIRPDVWFSVDVAPDSLSAVSGMMCQDTIKWLTDGLVDIVYPMAYGTTDAVKKWTGLTMDLCGDNAFAVIGLRDNGAETYSEQIVACREDGAAGTAFFSYSQYSAGDYKGVIENTLFALPAVNPTANAKNATIAEFERFIRKCDNYSAVSELLGVGSNSSPEQIVKTVTSVLEKLESSELSAEKDSLQSCIEELLDFAQDKSESDSTLDIGFAGYIERTVHSLKLLINTSKDDEKAIYAATHNSSISEDDPSNEVSESNDDSESEQVGDKVESNVFEKIIQFIFVGILLISLIGLPLFYYLDKRRKRIAKEYSGNNQKPDDSDKEDVGEVSEEPSNDDESSNEEKQEDNN